MKKIIVFATFVLFALIMSDGISAQTTVNSDLLKKVRKQDSLNFVAKKGIEEMSSPSSVSLVKDSIRYPFLPSTTMYCGYYSMVGNGYAHIFYGIHGSLLDSVSNAFFMAPGNGHFNGVLNTSAGGIYYDYIIKETYPAVVDGESGTFLVPTCSYSLNVSSIAICIGGTATLTATTNGSTPMFSWSNGGVHDSIHVSPTTNTTYTVTVNSNGCSETATGTVTVNTTPTATITPSATSICAGSSIQLVASGGSTYLWSSGLGSNQSVAISPTSTTTYTVTVSNGCSATSSVTITVSGSINPGISSNVTICPEASTTCTASGGTSYLWSDLETTSSISVSPTSTTTYTVTITNGSCTATEDVIVTVNDVTTNVGANVNVCSGSSVTLTATGATTYSWSNGLGLGATKIVSPTTTTTYTVTGTTTGCSSSATITVTVLSLPVVTATASETNICSGISTVLAGTGAISYTWNHSVGDGNYITVSPTTTTTYVVTGTDNNGCTNTDFVTVVVKQSPHVTISPINPTVCSNSIIPLDASGATTYEWSNGTFPSVGYHTEVTPIVTTIYTVTGTGSNGCMSVATDTINTVDMPIYTDVIYSMSDSMLVVESDYFQNPISITINGTTYTTIYQNTIQAVFYHIHLNGGEEIDIQAVGISNCYAVWIYNPNGILTEDKENLTIIEQNELIYLLDMNGRIVQTINSPKDFMSSEIFQIENLFQDKSSGIYFWRSSRSNPPIVKKFSVIK